MLEKLSCKRGFKLDRYEKDNGQNLKSKAVHAVSEMVFKQLSFRNYCDILLRPRFGEVKLNNGFLKKESDELEKSWQKTVHDFKPFAEQIKKFRKIFQQADSTVNPQSQPYLEKVKNCFIQVESKGAKFVLINMLFAKVMQDPKRFKNLNDYLTEASRLTNAIVGAEDLHDNKVVFISLDEIVSAVLDSSDKNNLFVYFIG